MSGSESHIDVRLLMSLPFSFSAFQCSLTVELRKLKLGNNTRAAPLEAHVSYTSIRSNDRITSSFLPCLCALNVIWETDELEVEVGKQ
jgi:hypothetical protein